MSPLASLGPSFTEYNGSPSFHGRGSRAPVENLPTPDPHNSWSSGVPMTPAPTTARTTAASSSSLPSGSANEHLMRDYIPASIPSNDMTRSTSIATKPTLGFLSGTAGIWTDYRYMHSNDGYSHHPHHNGQYGNIPQLPPLYGDSSHSPVIKVETRTEGELQEGFEPPHSAH